LKPNILVISNYNDPVNPIRPEAEIFIGLAKMGFDITVITPTQGQYPEKLKRAGCEIIDYLPKNKFDKTAIQLIKKTVARKSIKIVHAFNSKAIANSAWALWNNKSVKLATYRGYTGNIHWYDPTNYVSFLNPRIDYMVCLAESVREMYLKSGVSPKKAITINKGHKREWYDHIAPADLQEFNFEEGALVCSFVANFRTKMKGVNYLIEAVSRLPKDYKIHFLMIGEGLDTDEVVKSIADLGLKEKFRFTGFRKDASNLVKACDVSISASIFGEATQKAMIEAMYLGNAVIMTDISGNRGMIENGVSGIIVPPKNAEALAAAIIKLYKDSELRMKMAQGSLTRVTTHLSNERTVEEYKAFYERISA